MEILVNILLCGKDSYLVTRSVIVRIIGKWNIQWLGMCFGPCLVLNVIELLAEWHLIIQIR